MKITRKKGNARGTGRLITEPVRYWSAGMSAHGGKSLEHDGPDNVSIHITMCDGADGSVSSSLYITVGLTDDADALDGLIARLTELRARQRKEKGAKE